MNRSFQGLTVTIDRPKGFVQKGKDADGQTWERTYKFDYGFLPKTEGGDGEDLDVFLGPEPYNPMAYWVVQKKNDGSFDEYKVFLGFKSAADAKKAYADHIPMKHFVRMFDAPVAMIRSLLGKQPDEKAASLLTLLMT